MHWRLCGYARGGQFCETITVPEEHREFAERIAGVTDDGNQEAAAHLLDVWRANAIMTRLGYTITTGVAYYLEWAPAPIGCVPR